MTAEKFKTAGSIVGLLFVEFFAWFAWTLVFSFCDLATERLSGHGLSGFECWFYFIGCLAILILTPILIDEEE